MQDVIPATVLVLVSEHAPNTNVATCHNIIGSAVTQLSNMMHQLFIAHHNITPPLHSSTKLFPLRKYHDLQSIRLIQHSGSD
ncbi:hypothetical protein SCLCIDRAFT_34815 [Scleroderma citrinum Foug A]|uniref:Uncharacterized protein n=1 Tax=Scleroderma citrinum Foug A TaxID=1036808 RepID=A0A0C3D1I6_9AGAM|nr:hypothetical protein SCLCIDRAFT_34815 [Scleroderma citrinum Foug A]